MSRLIKIEMKKLMASKAFKITLLVCMVMGLFSVIVYSLMIKLSENVGISGMNEMLELMQINGYEMFMNISTANSDIMMFTTILMCILIAGDFQGRTLQSQIIAGYSRNKIVISRMVTSYVLFISFQFVYTFVITGGVSLFIEFGREITGSLILNMIKVYFMSMFMSCSIILTYLLVIFLAKSLGLSLGITMPLCLIGTSILSILGGFDNIVSDIYSFTPFGQMGTLSIINTFELIDYVKFFGVGIVYAAIVIVIIFKTFKKSELK